jgi:hypothetical protein
MYFHFYISNFELGCYQLFHFTVKILLSSELSLGLNKLPRIVKCINFRQSCLDVRYHCQVLFCKIILSSTTGIANVSPMNEIK